MAAAILCPGSERFAEDNCYKLNGSVKKHKRGRQKIVTWPVDEKLCEVRHFFAGDAPSLLGVAVQGFLHYKQQNLPLVSNTPSYKEFNYVNGSQPTEAKRSRFTSIRKPDCIPPGCGLSMCKQSPVCEIELEALMAIAAPWHCPPKFIMEDSWLWAGGEESTEVALQHQRELRLLEAFYPRLASIPDSPAEPLELLGSCKQVNDSSVVLIPLIPLEEAEEEDMQDVASQKMIESICFEDSVQECRKLTDPLNHGADVSNLGNGVLHSSRMAESVKTTQANPVNKADSNIAAIAAAACMVVKSLGQSDLVDEKLLLEILKNPSMLDSLSYSNQLINSKSKVTNNDTIAQISQEHGQYLNGSPISVLARQDEGSLCTTPIACENTNIQQPMIPATMDQLVMSSISAQSLRKPTHDSAQRIATRTIPERLMDIPLNSTNLQSPSLVHAHMPKDESRPSCQSGRGDDMYGASCSMQSRSAVATLNGPSVCPTMLSNSALPYRTPPLGGRPVRRFVPGAEGKFVQEKKTAPGVLHAGSGGRTKRFCMFFNSPRGCRNGGSCSFLHQSLDSELNTTAL